MSLPISECPICSPGAAGPECFLCESIALTREARRATVLAVSQTNPPNDHANNDGQTRQRKTQ